MLENLDLKDRKLLFELDRNSRRTLNELGKKIGLSKNSVMYRIENLKQQGIIKSFHTILDVGKLGYTGYRLYLSLQGVTKNKEKEIIDFLIKQKIVTWLVSVDGKYDLAMLILIKDIKELTEFWNSLFDKYINFIGERNLSIMNSSEYYSRSYLLEKEKNNEKLKFISEPSNEKFVDKTDLKILNYLSYDANISIVDLCSKTKLNPKTIISRIKNLEKNKIILGYKAVFDLEKISYQYYKIHFRLHNTTSEKLNNLHNFVFSHPNIIYKNEIIGGDDLDIELQVKSVSELRNILETIKEKFGQLIFDYEILHYYKEHKYILLPV